MNEPIPLPAAAALPPVDEQAVRRLPTIFRLQSIARLPFDDRHVLNRAVLFHEQAMLPVEWISARVDARLVAGALVSIRWLGRPVAVNGAVRIARLVALVRPDAGLNPFDTVPVAWVSDRALVKRAGMLWARLPPAFAHLFNAIFWRTDRFHRYLTGPSALDGPHATRFGTLRRCIEVAERALALAGSDPRVHRGVLILAALLHDAGKADAYRLGHQQLELSDRGRLIGHQFTVFEWIAIACVLHQVKLPDIHYLALVHALTCAWGDPAGLGLHEPQRIEAAILGAASRRSGPGHHGSGRDHPRHPNARSRMLTPVT